MTAKVVDLVKNEDGIWKFDLGALSAATQPDASEDDAGETVEFGAGLGALKLEGTFGGVPVGTALQGGLVSLITAELIDAIAGRTGLSANRGMVKAAGAFALAAFAPKNFKNAATAGAMFLIWDAIRDITPIDSLAGSLFGFLRGDGGNANQGNSPAAAASFGAAQTVGSVERRLLTNI